VCQPKYTHLANQRKKTGPILAGLDPFLPAPAFSHFLGHAHKSFSALRTLDTLKVDAPHALIHRPLFD
jgi:hypothetical protein